MIVCAGCNRPIFDQYLLNVLDQSWHASCVQCSDCSQVLTERCFSREGKLFCRHDFFKRFGTKCSGCSEGISPSDLVRKARDKVFHLRCFTCMVCRKQLSTGEELVIFDESRFVCKEDYVQSKIAAIDSQKIAAGIKENGTVGGRGRSVKKEIIDENDYASTIKEVINDGDKCSLSPSTLAPPRSGDSKPGSHSMEDTEGNTSLALIPTMPNTSTSSSISPKGEMNNNNSTSSVGVPSPNSSEPGDITNLSDHEKGHTGSEYKDNDLDLNLDDLSDLKGDGDDSGDEDGTFAEDDGKGGSENGKQQIGSKRRGPRTTIKAKQLETLKAAFNATPKPTRHIREQLAQETGLNMRVIQVWFQNRRSKERRMKQLSAMGARRGFFRNPRRMRALRAGMGPDEVGENGELIGFGYFDNGDYYNGYSPVYPAEFFHPSQAGHPHFPLGPNGQPMDPSMHSGIPVDNPQFFPHPDFVNSQNAHPPPPPTGSPDYCPPRSLPSQYLQPIPGENPLTQSSMSNPIESW